MHRKSIFYQFAYDIIFMIYLSLDHANVLISSILGLNVALTDQIRIYRQTKANLTTKNKQHQKCTTTMITEPLKTYIDSLIAALLKSERDQK